MIAREDAGTARLDLANILSRRCLAGPVGLPLHRGDPDVDPGTGFPTLAK